MSGPDPSPAIALLLARLPVEEGTRLIPYDDATGLPVRAPKGHLSWGRGFNLTQCGSPGLFDVMERYLLEQIEARLRLLSWYALATPVRQSVALDIAYNSGVHGLLGFPLMIGAYARGDWKEASIQCADENPTLDASRYRPLRALILSG